MLRTPILHVSLSHITSTLSTALSDRVLAAAPLNANRPSLLIVIIGVVDLRVTFSKISQLIIVHLLVRHELSQNVNLNATVFFRLVQHLRYSLFCLAARGTHAYATWGESKEKILFK